MEKEFDMQVEWSKHIQVYFTSSTTKFYDLLKALHHNLDSYSIAQILRFTIQYFLNGVARHGSVDAFLDTLEYKDETVGTPYYPLIVKCLQNDSLFLDKLIRYHSLKQSKKSHRVLIKHFTIEKYIINIIYII